MVNEITRFDIQIYKDLSILINPKKNIIFLNWFVVEVVGDKTPVHLRQV